MSTPLPLQAAPDLSSPLEQGFLLIEPATIGHEPFLQTLPMHACTPRVLAHREELMPRLVDLAALEPDVRAKASAVWRSECGREGPPVICGWLDSEADIDEVAAHIAQHLVGPGEDGKPVLWRHYDPRVLSLTLAIFDTPQRAALRGPIKQWQFAWAGHRWSIANLRAVPDDADRDAPGWPRPEQWLRINRSEAAARVVERLPAIAAEDAAHLPTELDRIFCEAERRGRLPGGIDVLADYAWHCLRYGRTFEDHPGLLDAWPALVQQETGWADVLNELMAEDFDTIKKAPRAQTT